MAFPTETVYGLGACCTHEQAVHRLFEVKGRPRDNPLIAHVASMAQIESLAAELPEFFFPLFDRFFPGPLTLILPRRPSVLDEISAGLPTIAVRMPSHRCALQLIEEVGCPIVAPSANVSGRPSSTCVEHVLEDFAGKIAAVVDGGEAVLGLESTVLDIRGPEPLVLRPGQITREQIQRVLQVPVRQHSGSTSAPSPSPGTRYRHYAPRAKVLLFFDHASLQKQLQQWPDRTRIVLGSMQDCSCEGLPLSGRLLYARFRMADQMGCEEICVLCDATKLQDAALMDRLARAATEEERQ